jgi:hypothetical protein
MGKLREICIKKARIAEQETGKNNSNHSGGLSARREEAAKQESLRNVLRKLDASSGMNAVLSASVFSVPTATQLFRGLI